MERELAEERRRRAVLHLAEDGLSASGTSMSGADEEDEEGGKETLDTAMRAFAIGSSCEVM